VKRWSKCKKEGSSEKKFKEAYAKEKAVKASAVQSETPSANAKKIDSSVIRSDAIRVAVASSAKHSADDTLSISEEIPLSKQTKVSEHSTAVQAI